MIKALNFEYENPRIISSAFMRFNFSFGKGNDAEDILG